ncbi:hypothetical protein [Flavobacterium sp.]
MENQTVLIGIHDGRLILENSMEIDELVILELKKFAKENSLIFASQIDNIDDVMFDYSECEKLEKELEYILSNTKSNSVKVASESILALTKVCIQKRNRRIKLYVAGN